MCEKTKILLLAGEDSGLIYANLLRERFSNSEVKTYQDYFPTSSLAVMGFIPVLKKLFFFLKVARTMKALIREWKPDVVVTIDYPGLNLKLASYAKKLDIPTVHIVCPQVWAWHKNRIPKIAASLSKLLCFFPFEPGLFEKTSLDAKFIGHPLVDTFDNDKKAFYKDESKRIVAMLPGSRLGEINRILPRLLETVKLLSDDKSLRFIVPAATHRARVQIEEIVKSAFPKDENCPVEIQDGEARNLLRNADVAAVASGTATLEAALAKCPTVLVYAASPALVWFARRVIKDIKHIGLANIIAEKTSLPPPMPELIQEDFTPKATSSILRKWLDSTEERARAIDALNVVTSKLKTDGGTINRAIAEINQLLKEKEV